MTPIYDTAGPAELFERSAVARRNRRRQWVFFGTLLVACVASLLYVYLRPAQYQATARWQFVIPESSVQSAASQRPNAADPAFLTQLQVITSRPLLERLQSMLDAGRIPSLAGGSIDGLQRSLQVWPVPGTTVVEVSASGPSAELLAPVVNTLFKVYQQQLDAGHRTQSGDAWAKAHDEATALQVRVAERRRDVDQFRARYNIVSLERGENEVLSQLQGQSTSLNQANEKLVTAEARLKSLRASLASGKGAVRARDNPIIAGLERRLSEAREELRLIERKFTEDYMNLDPNAKDLRLRVANLTEQLKEARGGAQQGALSEAEAEVASARAAVDRLSSDMSGSRRNVQAFTARMAEYKAMQADLDQLEEQKTAAVARATELEMSSRRVAPTVSQLEPASTPQKPIWPHYTRDAGAAVAGSLLLALLAVGLIEMLNRPEPVPTMVMVDRGWGALGGPAQTIQPLAFDTPARQLPAEIASPPLLEPAPLPRELDPGEVTALLNSAPLETRLLLMALLSGLSTDEAADLTWDDVDLSAPGIRLPDRTVPLAAPMAAALSELAGNGCPPGSPVFANGQGRRRTAADLESAVVFAALDAGLAYPGEVNSGTLRHTCVAHLVRQGARFGDLSRWVGRLPPDALGIVVRLAPDGPKRPAEQIDPVHPALRRA